MVDTGSEILSYFTNRIQAAKEQQLTELDLSVPFNTHPNDKLDHIPAAVFELTQLEKLDLSGNSIKEMPQSLTKLTNLTQLYLGSNSIEETLKSLTKLTNLTQLDLSYNGIKEIPESLTKLTNLTQLDLSYNGIKEIPESLTRLTNLAQLDLKFNALGEISRSLTKLTNLTQLNLSGNSIKDIPESLTKLTNLAQLNLSDNSIKDIPESLTKLTNLTQLNLSGNSIKDIPESISSLTNLVRLNLSGNGIEEIPESISSLTNLIHLNLKFNNIKRIPKSITNLTNSNRLDLSRNGMEEIPESITSLSNLTHLNLKFNNIKKIPESIIKLINLTQLDLSGNGIEEISESIIKLINLTQLDLSGNGIEEISESITSLSSLTHLNLSFNGIKEIPVSITSLSNLTQLNLSNNGIKEIPVSITSLSKLAQLDLSFNKIKQIPEDINNLASLTQLDVSHNKIKKIPKSINNLNNLILFKLNDNEIVKPPLEIVEQGIKSINKYFRQLEAGKDYIYEAKLIIVGEGGAGKTTLAKKIHDPNYKLRKNETTTEGIDIITWKFPLHDKNREFRVNIWDFGGQEIYHTTHQFFLTKRSLYALVADTRKEDTDFYYWLNVVELLSDNSPLLIIKNEKQERKREINQRALRGQFTNLKETLATNLQTNRGLPEIVTNIQDYIKKLPHIGQELPKTWIKVRETLESDTRNYISLEEYFVICENNGFVNLEDKLQLSQYLHDLGVCLHFQEQEDSILYKTVILKPEWGTDAVYKVLDSEQVINNQGCFTRNDLKDIWHESQYTLMRGELLELMSKFQLCYEITDQKDTFISPQLLSENQPEYDWNESNNLVLRYEYPNFMLKGIITRFIVVMHQYIDQQQYVWKSGVILSKDNTKAEVIENYSRREITIKVSGLHCRNLITIIAHELDKINDSYPGLKYNKLIPCNCQECQSSKETYFYVYKELQKLIQKNPAVQCRISGEMVNIRRLIDDVFIRDNFKRPGSTEDHHNTKIEQYIEQHFHGDVDNATGSIARDQHLTDTTIKSDRNTKINQGNYNEHVADDSINYSGVVNTIHQLPNFDHEPVKQELKELLSQLPQIVLATELDQEEQAESLEQIQAIAFSLYSQNTTAKKTAKKAIKRLRGTAIDLPADAALVVIGNRLSDLISQIYSRT